MGDRQIYLKDIKSKPLKALIITGCFIVVILAVILTLAVIIPTVFIGVLIPTIAVVIAIVAILILLPIAFIINHVKRRNTL